jgi:ribosomal protein S18 acetylase RimI-like enzyme
LDDRATPQPPVVIRPARPTDVLAMIRELAEFERSLHEVQATEDVLRASLFAETPQVFCHLAELDGEPVGFAVWFVNLSAWMGRHRIYLDDLYVRPRCRRLRAGQ